MKWFYNVLPFFFLVTLWHTGVITGVVDQQFFPSPVHFSLKLIRLFFDPGFLSDCGHSAFRLLLATLISIPLAFTAAFACAHSVFFDRILNPLVAFTFPLPKVAILPLILLVLGIGDTSKIFIISLGMFYLLFINMRLGLIHLRNGELGDLVKIYPLPWKKYFFSVVLKGIKLEFLKGLKLAMGYGLTLVVVSEFTMSRNGIGNFIWKAWDQFKVIDMYAGVLLLCVAGFVTYLVIDNLIKKNKKYYY